MREHSEIQDIVLIGGGHSHAVLLQRWAQNPVPGARLTLVSPHLQSAFSRMLPGMIAGHYSHSDIHINLPRLCRAAGARFVQACAHQIDVEQRRISLLGRPQLEYDLLSLDVGATPNRGITGAELAIPVKPADHFQRNWQQLRQQILSNHQPFKLAVVGGGAGGCELAMAMACALEEQLYSGRVEIHLVQAGNKLPQGFPLLARRLAARELSRLKIQVHRNWRVTEITHGGIHNDEGKFLGLDKVMLCTEPTAPPWLAQSGLALDENGFVQVDHHLRARGHYNVFAAGDVAALPDAPAAQSRARPSSKSCANALHQGETLYRNLRATLQAKPLTRYRARGEFFRLLTCGGQRAIASRSGIALAGEFLWRWKDYRDRRFLQQLNLAPAVRDPATAASHSPKNPVHKFRDRRPAASRDPLHRLLQPQTAREMAQISGYPLGNSGGSPLSIKVPAGKVLLQHTQQLAAPVTDPWLFGRLAALNALGGIYAGRAQPHSAQALVTLPHATADTARRDLQQLLDGVRKELDACDCTLNGGQASAGGDLHLGLTINGLADRERLLASTGTRAGDCLILSKPLGTGTLLAADALGKSRARWLQQGLDVMLQSNAPAADIFTTHRASALAAVGSIGLLGKLLEMLQWQRDALGSSRGDSQRYAPQLGACLFAETLPLLPGATYCLQRGLLPSLQRHNARAYDAIQNPTAWQAEPYLPILIDPQVCGGLLASVPAEQAEACLQALHSAGCRHSAIIGFVDELPASGDQLLYAPQPIHLSKNGDWKQMAERYTELIS